MVPKSEQGTLRDIHFLSVILHTSPPVIITLTSLFFILPLGLLKIQTKSYTLTYTHVPPPNPSSVEWSNYTLPYTSVFITELGISPQSTGHFCHCFSQLHSTSINGPHYRDIWVISSLCLLQIVPQWMALWTCHFLFLLTYLWDRFLGIICSKERCIGSFARW